MRYIKTLFVIMTAALLAACKPEPIQEGSKDPQAPVIETASLTGLSGENTVLVGSKVKFSAKIRVENSTLESYKITIANGGEVIGSASSEIGGEYYEISEELTLSLDPATLMEEFYPEVTLKVTNKDGMYAEKTLAQTENVKISIPELMDALWLVDNNGKVFQMSPVTGDRGNYRTSASLAELGESFKIVDKITPENTVDPSAQVWSFETPETGEYGLLWIGFNYFTEEISKLLDFTATIDFQKMASDGEWKVFWSYELIRDCRVVFLNFPEGLQLQGDRFADVDKNTARYTGHTKPNFEIYYYPLTKWLVVKNQYVDLDEIWVTGLNASHPMSPFTDGPSFNWFETPQQSDAANMVKVNDNDRKLLVYLKGNFELKLYTERKWATELEWKSVTPETLEISEMTADEEGNVTGNFGLAGPGFTEGLWVLNYNISTKEASLTKYKGKLPVVGAGSVDPLPEPEPGPEPDPEPVVPASLYIVDAASRAFPMTLVSGNHFVSSEMTSEIVSPFVIAEKLTSEGKVDYTGKVWGMKDGKVAEIDLNGEKIPVDPVFSVNDKTPDYIGFDTAAAKVIYRQEVFKPTAPCSNAGCTVSWVQVLPEGCEVYFKNFDGLKISEVIDKSLFGDINDETATALHLGVSENYELHFRTDYNWLIFMSMISSSKMLVIGKNAAVGMASNMDFPIIDSTISTNPGQTVQMYKRHDGKWYGTINAAEAFGGSMYAGFGWGDMVKDLSAAGDYIKVNDGQWLATGGSFMPGKYMLCYDPSAKTVGMEPLK